MTASDNDGSYLVRERRIPVPRHLSPQTQAALAAPLPPRRTYPAPDDLAGWRAHIAATEDFLRTMLAPAATAFGGQVRELREGEARAFELLPEGYNPADRRVYLDIHGGGLINGAGEVCRMMAMSTARQTGVRTVSVDYRMPPDHPFPAGLDDCLAFYKALLREQAPGEIIVGGASAGGNLAAATVLKARDEGLPLPAGLVLLTPELDLTESGDSFHANLGVDRVLTESLMPANLLYAGGAPLDDPYVSPLFGDMTKGFAPTFITAGTRDLFLSNAVRMHRALRRAGVPVELHVFEALSHGQYGGPEDAEIAAEAQAFRTRIWASA